MINYTTDMSTITPDMLDTGFFVGWPNPPSTTTHLQLLQSSYKAWVAIDDGKVIGFINAVSDGVLSAYIPLLEVVPAYQGKGIGKALTQHMLDSLNHLYMVDLLCDENMQNYYEKFNMYKAQGMLIRNYGSLK